MRVLKIQSHSPNDILKERSLPYAAIDLLDRTAAAVRLCNKNARASVSDLEADFEEIKSLDEKISEGPL